MSPRLRLILRAGSFTLATLIAIAVLSILALVPVLRSENGTQWLLRTTQSMLPELHIEQVRGNLIDGIEIGSLRWDSPDLLLALDHIEARLRWPDLLRGFATVEPLRVQRLSIEPRGPDSTDPITLPKLVSPLVLNVPRLQLTQLDIRNGETLTTLSGIDGAVRWIGPNLRLRGARLRYADLDLAADGQIRFIGDYPLGIDGKLSGASLPGPATVQTRGSLRVFKLKAQLSGDWPLTADGELRLLDDHLPLRLNARLAQAVKRDFGADNLTLHTAELHASGNLLRITGTAASRFTDGRYGEGELKSGLLWDGETLTADAKLQLKDGVAHSECALHAARPTNWGCRGDIANLPLTPWLNGLQGQISTPFTIAGRIENPLVLVALPAITGQLNHVALNGALQVDSPNWQHWNIATAALSAGSNQIEATGYLDTNSQLNVELTAPALDLLYGGLKGAARGKFAIGGALAQPSIRGELALQGIRYEDLQLLSGTLRLDVRELGQKPSDIAASLRGAQSGTTLLDADMALTGTRVKHRWQARVTHDGDRGEAHCDGALSDGPLYRLDCPTLGGKVAITEKKSIPISLDAPLHARWDGGRDETQIDALCLRSDPAALCVKPGLRLRQRKLQPFTATLTQLPVRWWRRALPEGLRLRNDARVNANLNFTSQKPLRLAAEVNVDASAWRWRDADSVQTINLDPVRATADLNDKQARLAATLHAPGVGGIDATLNVTDPLGARQLQGRFALNALQLSAFGWAVPEADTLSGQVDGAVTFAGTLKQPLLQGQFDLTDGTVGVGGSDPLTDLNARLHFDNQRASLDGRFRLGDGSAQLSGTMAWLDVYRNWEADVQLKGDGLQFDPIAASTIQFAPALELKATPTRADLSGSIAVQKADIRLQQLPPDTVNPSRDAVVSGRETAAKGIALNTDINLHLGKQTHFAGFGADVDLTGDLRLHQQAGQQLEATGRINVAKGRYRAYGQRLIVRRGQFIFIGNLDNPDLNLEAVRDMPPGNTDVVGLRVTGSLREPVAQLFSEQSMTESDIAYYLLTGRKRETLSQGGSQFTAGGTLLSLGLAGSEDKASKLAEKFGISGLQLGTAAATNGGTEAEVSGYLFRDLYVRYGRTLGEQVNSVTLQYQLSPNLMIQTISGIEETLELIYTFTID